MSKLSELDLDRQTVRDLMDTGEPSDLIQFAEDKVARRVNGVINDLDELCAMAANAETVDLIENERLAVWQILTRAQLIAAFLAARQPQLKVVSRG